jgi:hypothetical protein
VEKEMDINSRPWIYRQPYSQKEINVKYSDYPFSTIEKEKEDEKSNKISFHP